MAQVNKFEELVVSQKSMDFCDEIFHIINNTPLKNDVNQIGKMLGSLINYLKKDSGYKKVAEPEIKYGKPISSIVDEITISNEIYL